MESALRENKRKDLFYRFKKQSERIRVLGSIVQNPVDLDKEQVDEWEALVEEDIRRLENLKREVRELHT